MPQHYREIRDPIYGFIRLDLEECKLLDSRPLQRLRHINQLGMTYLVYPGATHCRFEHSLGVMELATRVFDRVTNPHNMFHDSVRRIMPSSPLRSEYRRVLRVAALLHDVGHLPFSHVGEVLLPKNWDHNRLTKEIILSVEFRSILKKILIDPDRVARIAVGPKYFKDAPFDDWETILWEVIGGDAFGADRMDYLLRDSHHAGVAYGKFDHHRLIATLCILPSSQQGSEEPTLSIEEGGLHCAEALVLARYFMYTQVYYHHMRRICDRHLQDFLQAWLPSGKFSTDLEQHLQMTDSEVMAGILRVAREESHPGHDPARRLVNREHFRLLYRPNSDDLTKNLQAGKAMFEAARSKFGAENVLYDEWTDPEQALSFPVRCRDGRISSSLRMSEVLARMPAIALNSVYVSPELRDKAEKWRDENAQRIIARAEGGEK